MSQIAIGQTNSAINIVSFSGGKDSTAMLHLLLEQGVSIDYVIYFETEWDFPQMDAHMNRIETMTGLQIIRLRYYRHFNELLARYGWPHSSGGWCVRCKTDTCNKFIRHIKTRAINKTEYIGFTTSELQRTQRKGILSKPWQVKFPLIEAGMSEQDALDYCLKLGYCWDGLYEVFDRVSCFCCPKGGKAKRNKIQNNFPDLWREWRWLDAIAETAYPLSDILQTGQRVKQAEFQWQDSIATHN